MIKTNPTTNYPYFYQQEQKPLTHFSATPVGGLYQFGIRGEIGEADMYQEEINLLYNATEADTIHIKINSDGGALFTALEFINAIGSCQAKVVTEITGRAYSAAGIIFLHGHELIINDNSSFMAHEPSYGTSGKGSDIQTDVEFNQRYFREIMTAAYKDFMTDEELDMMLNGKSFFMTASELNDRLNNMANMRHEELLQEEDDEE